MFASWEMGESGPPGDEAFSLGAQEGGAPESATPRAASDESESSLCRIMSDTTAASMASPSTVPAGC
jgi:hypothetical protein